MTPAAEELRKKDLAIIHMAKAQINMADDVYRGHLASLGVKSSADLDAIGREKMKAILQAAGWKPTAGKGSGKRPNRPTPAAENLDLVRKVRAQLISLGRLPDTYADAITKKSFKVDFFEWCTSEQLHSLCAMLAIEQRRRGIKAPARKAKP